MPKKSFFYSPFSLFGIVLLVAALLAFTPFAARRQQVDAQTRNIFASPIQAGCYIAGPNDCRFHVEPLSINIKTGSKLMYFQILAQPSSGSAVVIYDFRPDVSNPIPFTGTVVTPSQVAQDFAATCGKVYTLSLQGRDTLDANAFNLGTTQQITCPSGMP